MQKNTVTGICISRMRGYASVIDDPVRSYRDENQQSRTTESTHGIVDRESIGLPRSAQLNAANAMVCKCGGRTCCDERYSTRARNNHSRCALLRDLSREKVNVTVEKMRN